MDIIKTEPELDPLAVESSEDVNVKETSPSDNEELFGVVAMKDEIKQEITTEENEILTESISISDDNEMDQDEHRSPENCEFTENPGFGSNNKLQFESSSTMDDGSFKCAICGTFLQTLHSLKMHFRTHGDRRFKCDICGKCFPKIGTLNAHVRTHTGEKPFKCDTCGKCFSQLGTLRVHIRMHTGEKPYKCDSCGKCFTESKELKYHSYRHSGEKRFKCSVCGKCFARLQVLKDHAIIHTGEKPFECDLCGRTFTYARNLKAHARLHNEQNDTDATKPAGCDSEIDYFFKRHYGII
ncbi:zinc finger protein 239-like [Periplaneta americana]|uniref:zinc finger protein 239-like n=1 Tax=Periplaneta americana TaxID=6978 RepID=UPI0037E879AD